MQTETKRPGIDSASEEWIRNAPWNTADSREFIKHAFEAGYQRGYDRGKSHVHGDVDEALDELNAADISGLSHASIGYSVGEDGSFVSDDAITLYVMDGWCDESLRMVERICDMHGCAFKVD